MGVVFKYWDCPNVCEMGVSIVVHGSSGVKSWGWDFPKVWGITGCALKFESQ